MLCNYYLSVTKTCTGHILCFKWQFITHHNS